MLEKTNDFRNKSEEEVFDMYKKIALRDYIYDELWNITKNNSDSNSFSDIIEVGENNG